MTPCTNTLKLDVGNPSNFIRILELFKHEYPEVKNVVSSFSITDEETRTTLKDVYNKYDYLLDPHGAVAFAGLAKYLEKHAHDKGMILETAHPVKFYDVVEPITGQKVETPETIKGILNKKKESVKLTPDYNSFKQFLLS
jgi:threonine synthase